MLALLAFKVVNASNFSSFLTASNVVLEVLIITLLLFLFFGISKCLNSGEIRFLRHSLVAFSALKRAFNRYSEIS